jgi:adenosine deaminase
LEGSLDAGWIRAQAQEMGKPIPESLEALWRRDLVDFEAFIQAFFFACGFLRGRDVVRETVRACVSRLAPAGEGLRGLDLWLSPHFLVKESAFLSLDELWQGMEDGIRDAEAQGVKVAVIIDAVNHFGVQHGHEVLDLVLLDKPTWIVGFSTGGLERVPFREWAKVFDRARAAGLRIAAHAGENGPSSNVREAILEGGAERIVHGVRAANDPATLELLAERRIPLDICITSNRTLVPDLGDHPLPRLLRAGVRCALGTDDPGVIPCDIPSEWAQAQALGLSPSELASLRQHAVEDAWSLAV